jgi:hypothetical protein
VKKLLIFISVFLFLAICVITALKLKNSVSPLKKPQIVHNEQILSSASLQISLPLIADSNRVYFTAVMNDTIGALFYLEPSSNTIFSIQRTYPDYALSGFSHENSKRLFMLSFNDTLSQFVLQENDTLSVSFKGPSLKNEKISSIALVNGVPEMITINDSVPLMFNRYVCLTTKDYQWESKPLRTNPFFMRISTPLGSYYKNNWYFMSSSSFFRRDSLYINAPSGTTNIMVFRSNLSYHFDDIRIEHSSFQKNNLEQSFSGLLKPMNGCNDMYSYNPVTAAFKQIDCPEGNHLKNIPVFYVKDEKIERLFYFLDKNDTTEQYVLRTGQNMSRISFVNENNRTMFKMHNDEIVEFALTKSAFNTPTLIPVDDDYLFLLDNGQYCILDQKMERSDNTGFISKAKNFTLVSYDNWINNLKSFSAWVFPFMIVSLPAFFVLSLFVFFIVKVFLTPKRPTYSSRKKKSTPYSSYFIPVAIIYIVGVVIFVFKFVSLLKII